MRFMMLMIPNLPTQTAEDWMPPVEAVEAMSRYNAELTKAGVLLAVGGLHPTERGARVSVVDGKVTAKDGPFSEAKEVIGGYWIIQVKSKEEAVEWAKRCPIGERPVIEVREIFELADFPAELQAAAGQ